MTEERRPREHVDPRSSGAPRAGPDSNMHHSHDGTDHDGTNDGAHGPANSPGATSQGGHAGPGEHAARDKHAGHAPDVFRRQFWVVLLLTIPGVIWSHEVQMWLGYTAPVFPGSDWVSPVIGTVVFLYGGKVFLDAAYINQFA